MNTKHLKTAGAISSALALISLALPVFKTVFDGGETWAATFRGINLVEFSPWGIIVLLVPLILSGIGYSKLNDAAKTMLNMSAFLLGLVSLYNAIYAMREWVYSHATGYVYVYGSFIIYAVLLIISAVLFHICCNIKQVTNTTSSVSPIYIYNEDFILSDTVYKFSKFTKDTETIDFDGAISFSTEDGYFVALGQGENEEYINNGCIELFDGDDNVGFAIKTTPNGIFGSFYGWMLSPAKAKCKVKAFNDIYDGLAQLWLPNEKKVVEITVKDIADIYCRFPEKCPNPFSLLGSPILQDGKIAAVLSDFDEHTGLFSCISAEIVAADLMQMVCKQRAIMAAN